MRSPRENPHFALLWFAILFMALGHPLCGLKAEPSAQELRVLGEVVVANRVAGRVDAPVFDIDCITPLSGPDFLVQLYYRPPDEPDAIAIPPLGSPTWFRRDAPGYFVGVGAGFPFFQPDGRVLVEVRVWEAKAGSFENAVAGNGNYGVSNPFLVFPEFGLGPAAHLVGLQSFCLVPEPSPVALGLAGLGCWVGWGLVRRFRWQGRISASR